MVTRNTAGFLPVPSFTYLMNQPTTCGLSLSSPLPKSLAKDGVGRVKIRINIVKNTNTETIYDAHIISLDENKVTIYCTELKFCDRIFLFDKQMLILQLVLGILMTVNKMVTTTGIVVDGLEHGVVISQLELEDGSGLAS